MEKLPEWITDSPEFEKYMRGHYLTLSDALRALEGRLRWMRGLAASYEISASRGELTVDRPPLYTEPAPYGL
jgi:chloramphenicol 3-O-phosphotransferase